MVRTFFKLHFFYKKVLGHKVFFGVNRSMISSKAGELGRTIIAKKQTLHESKKESHASPQVRLSSAIETHLKNTRSSTYLDFVKDLDLGRRTLTSSEIENLKNKIAEEIGDKFMADQLLGLLAKCRLGPEYHVHSLNFAGSIIKHYKIGENVDAEFMAAIPHALQSIYEFIEVYKERLVCVYPDGRTTEIKLK